jgi:glycopeptide antibiotics resistance protein
MKKTGIIRSIVVPALFAVYLYLLVKAILFKFGPIEGKFLLHQFLYHLENPGSMLNRLSVSSNFIPFKQISSDVRSLHNLGLFQLNNFTGNIYIFIPFGIFVPLLYGEKNVSLEKVFFLSFLLSLMLESSQAILSIGTFDVDDLLLNSSGGMIGFGIYSLFGRRTSDRLVSAKQES